jgi:hypothetical protein
MGRSIKARLAAVFVVAIASFGIFAGAAFGSGLSSIHSTNSYSSPPGGTCHAATSTPAGYVGHGLPVTLWPLLFCEQQ